MTECAAEKVLSAQDVKRAPEWATDTKQGGLLQALLVYVANVVYSSKGETYAEQHLCAHQRVDRSATPLPLITWPLSTNRMRGFLAGRRQQST